LLLMFAAVMVLAVGLIVYTEQDRLPPGRYVPAQLVNGQIVPGHSAQALP
jgi:predicted lipoprotein